MVVSKGLRTAFSVILAVLVMSIAACGSTKGSDPAAASSTSSTGGSTGSTGGSTGSSSGSTSTTSEGPFTVTVTANPSDLTVGGTSAVTAVFEDSAGLGPADGTQVTWSLSDTNLGTITATSTTTSGEASATFTASSTAAGSVVISAKASSYTGTVSITISPAETGSVVFTSATPQTIGIKASGQTETSIVIFSAKDVNGNAATDGIKVDVCMKGPSGGRLPDAGGEYIGDLMTVKETFTDANGNGCYDYGETFTDTNSDGVFTSPEYGQVTTASGDATVRLHSGKVAGNVTLFATIVGTELTSASSTISIGGGVPTDKSFTVAASKLALEGYSEAGLTSDISVYVADRFGNSNILTGVTANFYSNAGAIGSTGTTTDGTATKTYRTQNPAPSTWTYRSAAEIAYVNDLGTRFGVPTTIHPRNALATVLVTVVGEEDFNDENGNGVYDTGEPFTDLTPEPFIDGNGDGSWDDGTNDLWEQYVDVDGNGAFGGTGNGEWDSRIVLYRQINIRWTDRGQPAYLVLKDTALDGALSTSNTFNLVGTANSYTLLAADSFLNKLPTDAVIEISTSGTCVIDGNTSVTISDTNQFGGATEMVFTLAGSGSATVAAGTIKVSVTQSDSSVYTNTWYGTCD